MKYSLLMGAVASAAMLFSLAVPVASQAAAPPALRPEARPAGNTAVHAGFLRHLVMGPQRVVGVGLSHGRLARRADTRGPARMSGADLAPPQELWSGMTGFEEALITPSNLGPFTSKHSKGYPGLVGGYAADATLNGVGYFYKGSYFTDAAAATAVYQDGLNTTNGDGVTNDCTADAGVPCYGVTFQTDNGVANYEEARVNYCLIETQVQGDASYLQANAKAVLTRQFELLGAGIALAQRACTGSAPSSSPSSSGGSSGNSGSSGGSNGSAPSATATPSPTPTGTPVTQPAPQIGIDAVGLFHRVKGKTKATGTLKNHEKGLFVVAYHTANAGTNTASGTVTFTVSGHKLGTDQLTADTLSDGTTVMGTVQSFGVKARAAHVTAAFTLQLGTATATRSFTFTVKPKKK